MQNAVLKTCICCLVERPLECFTIRTPRGSSRSYPFSYCKPCHGSHAHRIRVRKKNGLPQDEVTRLANEWWRRRALGLPTKNLDQSDLSVECAKIGAEPGHMHDAMSRQQLRAKRRRIIKDAQQAVVASRRPLTKDEVVESATKHALDAKSRAAGGQRQTTRNLKKKGWNLSEDVSKRIVEEQDYRCALTGLPFEASEGWGTTNPFGPSPNQKDPGAGYLEPNAEFVLWCINRMIGDIPRPLALLLLAELKLLRRDFHQLSLL